MPSRRTLLKSTVALLAAPELVWSDQQSINRKTIPSSGESIPVVGIGTNRYGVGSDVQALAPLRDTLSKFASFGGGVIDTAPGYRNSESVLGKLIDELSLHDRFFIATKCDVVGGVATRDQIALSQQKLKSGKLDLVAVHNLHNWQQQLAVLQEAKQAGTIRYLGVTTSRNSQHGELAEILKTQKLDFVQLNYSLADRAAEQELLPLAAERGVAVMVNLPFGRGRLFKAVKGQELPSWAADLDINSWAQYFLKFLVSHPAVNCAIPGTTKLHHMIDNFAAARGQVPDQKQRAKMAKHFAGL